MASSARQPSPEPLAAEPEPDEAPPEDDPPEADSVEPDPVEAAPDPDEPEASGLAADLAALVPPEEDRSFFAQPDPLKCTAGGAKTLRIRPPHSGHADGPWSWTPWTTSIRWPQFVQA